MDRHVRHLFLPQHTNNHRPRILHPEGFAVLSILIVGIQLCVHILSAPPARLPAVLGFSSSITVSQVVDQTNAQRLQAGLSPLKANTILSTAAQAKAAHMCKEQYWAHISPSGTTPWLFIRNAGYRYSVAGENLARDFSDTSSMVAAWMASPTHKANIVNARYAEIGVAVVDCKLLGSDTALVVQMFGSQVSRTGTAAPIRRGIVTQNAPTNVRGIETDVVNQSGGVPTTPEEQPEQIDQTENIPLGQSILLDDSTEITGDRASFTPLQFRKAFFLSILAILFVSLGIDLWLTQQRNTVRIVGRNVAHIVFLAGVTVVVLAVEAGVVL